MVRSKKTSMPERVKGRTFFSIVFLKG